MSHLIFLPASFLLAEEHYSKRRLWIKGMSNFPESFPIAAIGSGQNTKKNPPTTPGAFERPRNARPSLIASRNASNAGPGMDQASLGRPTQTKTSM